MADASVQRPSRDDLWRQYETFLDLHKHYLKLTIELNVFYYAITGAIVSYYFAHRAEALMRYSLLLPALMSLLFGVLFVYGAVANLVSRREVFHIRDALGLQTAPELLVLTVLLGISALLMILAAVGLGVLLIYSPSS